MIHQTAKVCEEVNRKLPARNTTVQLVTLTALSDGGNYDVTRVQVVLCVAARVLRLFEIWRLLKVLRQRSKSVIKSTDL